MISDRDAADRSDLAASLDELEQEQAGLRDIVRSGRKEWRNELVRKRRVMATLVTRVASLFDEFERGHCRDTVTLRIRKLLSEFRAALAGHQATYSAVMIEPSSSEYRASADKVRATCVEFCGLTRRTLDRNRS
jgi:hypothetical protein